MSQLDRIFDFLYSSSRSYRALKGQFDDLANNINGCIKDDRLRLDERNCMSGVKVDLHNLDEGWFTISFAGRHVRFVLNTKHLKEGQLDGVVRCYEVQHPICDGGHEKVEEFANFSLSEAGQATYGEKVTTPVSSRSGCVQLVLMVFVDCIAG